VAQEEFLHSGEWTIDVRAGIVKVIHIDL